MNMLNKKSLQILLAIFSIGILIVISKSLWNRYNNSFDNNNVSKSNAALHTKALRSEKPVSVIIDPGHGGWEPGACNGSINEKVLTLDISLEIEKLLKEKKIEYYMTRTDDTYVSLDDRVKISNKKQAELFVSIHNNSFTEKSQNGILTSYNPNSSTGKKIANIMQSKICKLGMSNRGIVPRSKLQVLRQTDMPSILVEIGFLSNTKDLKLILDTNFQKKCAKQIVLGIEEILSLKTTDEAKSSGAN